LGGGASVPGGVQPLRGFGQGRFTDRNVFSATLELRQRTIDLPIFNTNIGIEVTPFIDIGRVFHELGASPLSRLHKVYGIGFRGVAAPFIVGFVDVGYGSEGAAVFTGVNYPF
jgi:outer membrane protein assembly factor BamA